MKEWLDVPFSGHLGLDLGGERKSESGVGRCPNIEFQI